MPKRLTRQELFELRNAVSIVFVIENYLKLPSKLDGKFYKFLCPQCQEMRASVNSQTNLSRCFLCEENFNTIELVMAEGKMSFVEAVKALQALRVPHNNPRVQPLPEEKPRGMQSVGDILATIAKQPAC